MSAVPRSVEEFLAARRLAVAGVSRDPKQPANLIFRRLRDTGHEVIPVNPLAGEVEGVACFRDVRAVPGPVDAVVIATPPAAAVDVVRACAERAIPRVWMHRSFGQGSVSAEAVTLGRELGIQVIVGGCPMMYCGKVDVAHRCMRWLLELGGRIEITVPGT